MDEKNQKIRRLWKQGYNDRQIGEQMDLHRSTIGKRRRNKLELPVIRDRMDTNQLREGEIERGMMTVLEVIKDGKSYEKYDVEKDIRYLPSMFDKFIKVLKHNNFIQESNNMVTITTKGMKFHGDNINWVYYKQVN